MRVAQQPRAPGLCSTRRTRPRCRELGDAPSSPEAPLLAFTGGGIFWFWQAGFVSALRELDLSACSLSGVSAGALTAVLAASGADLEAAVERAHGLSVDAGVYRRGSLAGIWGPLVERWLSELTPPDLAARCTGRVTLLQLAVWPPWAAGAFSVATFADKQAVLDSALASAHVPLFLDGRFTRPLRGRLCVDGSAMGPRSAVALGRRWSAGGGGGGGAAATTAAAAGAAPASVFLVDHNDDARVVRTRGDWLRLTTREGLSTMFDLGRSYARARLADGSLDTVLRAAAAVSAARAA